MTPIRNNRLKMVFRYLSVPSKTGIMVLREKRECIAIPRGEEDVVDAVDDSTVGKLNTCVLNGRFWGVESFDFGDDGGVEGKAADVICECGDIAVGIWIHIYIRVS